jgi:hypothetical protein
VTAGPGTFAFIPRGLVHRFKNVGHAKAGMLDCSLPGGQDHFFKAISDLAARGGFTVETAMAASKAFETHFLAARRESTLAETPFEMPAPYLMADGPRGPHRQKSARSDSHESSRILPHRPLDP